MRRGPVRRRRFCGCASGYPRRWCDRCITEPSRVLIAANNVAVPFRLESRVMVPQRPFFRVGPVACGPALGFGSPHWRKTRWLPVLSELWIVADFERTRQVRLQTIETPPLVRLTGQAVAASRPLLPACTCPLIIATVSFLYWFLFTPHYTSAFQP
jgi:hypothetical protein